MAQTLELVVSEEFNMTRGGSLISCTVFTYWVNCTPTYLVAMLVLQKFKFLWRSTKEVKTLCPTRFVADATENSKKETWRPKCAALRLGYEQNQKATYCCSYLGHQNEVIFVGGISEHRLSNTTHYPPTFQCEAMCVSAKPLRGGWVSIGRWV